MHSAFGTVLLIVCAVSVVVAVLALAWNRRTWDEYGRRGLTFEREHSQAGEPSPEDEVRELLQARNELRARRGQSQVDVDQEVSRLTASAGHPAADPELREDIRQLVLARNDRLVRAGKPALDVEREIERELGALGLLPASGADQIG